jgi:hypothetical protein
MSVQSFRATHPRRAQVNDRLANQNARIREGVQSGALTKDQAKALHQQDVFVRQEERNMASYNGGHLTRAEQKSLNQQENGISAQIYAAKNPCSTG